MIDSGMGRQIFPEFVAARFAAGTKARLKKLIPYFIQDQREESYNSSEGRLRRNRSGKTSSADVHRYALELGLVIYERRFLNEVEQGRMVKIIQIVKEVQEPGLTDTSHDV